VNSILVTIILSIIAIQLILGLGSLCTYLERKVSALIQDRVGANRAGAYTQTSVTILKPIFFISRILGVLGIWNTFVCDSLKAILKEDFVPKGSSVLLHALAPFLALVPVILAFAVIPLAPDLTLFGEKIRPQVAAGLPSGILFFLAMGSLAVYGVIIAGYTGNNKFSLLGALRASAQMISYELAMGIALVTAIIHYGTIDLYDMVTAQNNLWGAIASPFMFVAGVIFFVAGMAETKRAPFDLPESESELVAGYFTEYSGMKFLLFWLAEFCEIALISVAMSVIFFGGWHPFPFLPIGAQFGLFGIMPEQWWQELLLALGAHAILVFKISFFCVLQVVIRWTLPRFRYDQVMDLGWKILIEVATVNMFLAAAWKLYMSS
jgi:NADH-quinone oxidoreductase subunit H